MSHNFQRNATHAPEIEFQIPIWSYLGFTTFYVEKKVPLIATAIQNDKEEIIKAMHNN
jgi:hypothetical protein